MENRFLITYSVPSTEYSGRINLFQWEDSDDNVRDFSNEKKNDYGAAFQIIEVIEIIESEQIELDAFIENRKREQLE